LNALNRVIALRAGYMWDQCPIPDDTLQPSGIHGNNHAFSIGTGLPIGPFHADIFFEYVLTEDREWNNSVGDKNHPGKVLQKRITGEFEDYNTYTFGIDLTYKF
jgi:long-subunit fatty acid transport protein